MAFGVRRTDPSLATLFHFIHPMTANTQPAPEQNRANTSRFCGAFGLS
jgi:hypothetical protein